MPVILAINGAVENYRPNFGSSGGKSPRKRRAQGGHEADDEQPESLDPILVAARQAYQQAPQALQQKKPVTLAQDIMSVPVATLSPETLLTDAWALMSKKGFRHIPIVSGPGHLVGIVSDRDLLRFPGELDGRTATPLKVSQIMKTEVITATPATDMTEIARVMLDERISALPIIDGARHPIGMVTVSDILRVLVSPAHLELWT
jgi:acetoin utilization protein AcuB